MPIAHFKVNLQLIHGPLACDAGAELGPTATGEVLGALEVDVEGVFLGEHVPDGEPRGALDEARSTPRRSRWPSRRHPCAAVGWARGCGRSEHYSGAGVAL